jgi:transcriptional regulator with XRE-family HTH domain
MSGKFGRRPAFGRWAVWDRHWNLYRVIYFREKAGWTQGALGRAIGYTGRSCNVTISRYETGNVVPTIDTQRRIAGALGCRHAELMTSLQVLALETELYADFIENGAFKTWAEYVDARGGLLPEPGGDDDD